MWGEDNDFNVQAMITRLMWTIWTSLSAVRERPLNLITHSLTSHLAGLSVWNCMKNCAVHQACAGVAKPNSMLLVKWQHLRNEVVFIWNTLWRINNGGWDGYKGWEEATIANVFSLYWMLKWCMYMMTLELLTHCGLVTPHGDIDLCHNWLR